MRINFLKAASYLLLLVFPFGVWAQKDARNYKAESEAFRKEIWGWNKPEFKVRAVPAEYANASRVVIARHYELISDSRKKAAFTGLGFGMYRELTVTEVVREAIKINDKSAVEDYSEFSYTQMEKRSGLFMSKTTSVYVGVKVIKADGSIKEIDADDVVLTKDQKKEKEAKIAIPDLQVGDIVDYFIAKQTSMEQAGTSLPSYTFTFYDDSPVMHYSIHCEIGKKYAVEYRCYNGAPDFKQSRGEDDGIVLDAVKKNIPATSEVGLWTSAYRQLPIIRMNIMVGYKGLYAGRFNARRPGEVYKNQDPEEFVEDEINSIAAAKMGTISSQKGVPLSGAAMEHYKKLKEKRRGMSKDSLAAELYYAYRFDKFLDIDANTAIEDVVHRTSLPFSPSGFLFTMGLFFKNIDINNDLILTTSKYGPEMKTIMSKDDITYMMLLKTPKPQIFGVSDMFSPAFHIPASYENTKQAITLDTKGYSNVKPKDFDRGVISIPASSASENMRVEKLRITPLTDRNLLQVGRNVTLTGHYKSDVQQALILFEDYYESERKIFGQKKSLIEKLEDGRKSKKYAEELRAAFAEARRKQKDAFVDEAKEWFEQEVSDLTDYKIENMGVRHNAPDFVYSAQFNLGGLLKKAGSNYLVEIGKLQGVPLKVEDNQRKRSLDVYAPFARSFRYEITMDIPAGYTAEGVSALNRNIDNVSGSFVVAATSDGKTVKVVVSKAYKNIFEPSSNWVNLLAFIDASNEWTNAKILLKKK